MSLGLVPCLLELLALVSLDAILLYVRCFSSVSFVIYYLILYLLTLSSHYHAKLCLRASLQYHSVYRRR